MAFLKFSRDRRGYEHFYLMQPPGRGKGSPRLLYWFRTPPNIRIGRAPFDPEIRRSLETQNPDVAFDWKAIVQTPIPPPAETERWRERRRMERAMRATAAADEVESATEGSVPAAEVRAGDVQAAPQPPTGQESAAEVSPMAGLPDRPETGDTAGAAAATSDVTSEGSAAPIPGAARRRRRRRRRRPQPREIQKVEGTPQLPAVADAGDSDEPEEGV